MNKLSSAIDSINCKFGRCSVMLGGMHSAQDSDPDRIAFGSIPKLE